MRELKSGAQDIYFQVENLRFKLYNKIYIWEKRSSFSLSKYTLDKEEKKSTSAVKSREGSFCFTHKPIK